MLSLGELWQTRLSFLRPVGAGLRMKMSDSGLRAQSLGFWLQNVGLWWSYHVVSYSDYDSV